MALSKEEKNWLDEVKEEAEKLTKRRLEDDGYHSGDQERLDKEARLNDIPEAEVVEGDKSTKKSTK